MDLAFALQTMWFRLKFAIELFSTVKKQNKKMFEEEEEKKNNVSILRLNIFVIIDHHWTGLRVTKCANGNNTMFFFCVCMPGLCYMPVPGHVARIYVKMKYDTFSYIFGMVHLTISTVAINIWWFFFFNFLFDWRHW